MKLPDITDSEYRTAMDGAMEGLAVELFGMTAFKTPKSDAEIVEYATTKIRVLKKMILATGFHAKMLEAIMRDGETF